MLARAENRTTVAWFNLVHFEPTRPANLELFAITWAYVMNVRWASFTTSSFQFTLGHDSVPPCSYPFETIPYYHISARSFAVYDGEHEREEGRDF